MANITITAANVVRSGSNQSLFATAGETIAAGESVYPDAVTGRYMLADANVEGKQPTAVAANSASNMQPLTVIVTDNDLAVGTHSQPVGTPFFQSATPGKLCPLGDLTTGDYVSCVAVAKTATTVALNITTGGVKP